MFRYYLGIAFTCIVFAVISLFLAANPSGLAVIFTGLAVAFATIGLMTSGPKSRW
ncbi:hypothetical protein LSG31_18595 [Fodinisporobacter ferrooxydans]|uniref:Uncharacterized protein n=1 Tax=Fodinisporobacter ferrooxydans TaxID=2901836 RepID=A0ABY4CH69_9BACL|nr:hypothetical protein LSG31_18595 [Alicyclobacillaceae bacterium MYW30-H2]